MDFVQENPLEKEMATHPAVLPGKFHGQRRRVGYSPWGHKRVRTEHKCMCTNRKRARVTEEGEK